MTERRAVSTTRTKTWKQVQILLPEHQRVEIPLISTNFVS